MKVGCLLQHLCLSWTPFKFDLAAFAGRAVAFVCLDSGWGKKGAVDCGWATFPVDNSAVTEPFDLLHSSSEQSRVQLNNPSSFCMFPSR